jgi:hypothetical protein
VAVGDLPHAVLTPEHQRGAQLRDDRVLVAGDPAFVPLNLEDIAELRRGEPETSSKWLDTSSKCSEPPSWKFARRRACRLPHLGWSSTRRFQRIGKRDVFPVGEETHHRFQVAFDVDPQCLRNPTITSFRLCSVIR